MRSFFALIDRLIDAPQERRSDIEAFIWDSFQCEKAVLALDMSSFSLSVRRNGVVSHLCQIRRMQLLTGPIISASGGELLKYEADNLLAVFDDPNNAVEAAVAINQAVEAAPYWSESLPRLAVSIGIDFGPMLVLPGEDCFGDPVNVAHKLGEDIAGPGEVLITRRVHGQLRDAFGGPFEPLTLSMSGVDIPAYRMKAVGR
jgi:adenylate cyclase